MQHTREPVKKAKRKALPDSFHTPKNRDALEESPIGYLIDWRDSATPALLYGLLAAGANVRVATGTLTAQVSGDREK
jgi:hypothetical protein